jgi:hypothetical protein
MNPSDQRLAGSGDPAGAALDQALRAWAAPALPDDGFTQAVLRRVATARTRTGLAPAEAWQRLQTNCQHAARQARLTGLGLLLGLLVALAWLMAGVPVQPGGAAAPWPWALWLGAALAGTAGAVAWLVQQVD